MADYNDYFQNHDLALIAALVEHGFTLVDLDKSNERRVVFIFKDSAELQSVVDDYWLNKLKVNPKTYFDNQTLKNTDLCEIGMELLDTDIAKFQKLYKTRLGIELDDQTAYAKLSKLVRQVEIVYRPITKKQLKQLQDEYEQEQSKPRPTSSR